MMTDEQVWYDPGMNQLLVVYKLFEEFYWGRDDTGWIYSRHKCWVYIGEL